MSAVGDSLTHESARLHVSGGARYLDDIALPAGTLHAALGISPVAHGRIRSISLDAVRQSPGVVDVITAADLPGDNQCGPVLKDDPILAETIVVYAGQPVFAVLADSHENARRAARRARLDIEPLPAVLDIESALAQKSFVLPTQTLARCEPERVLNESPMRLKGRLAIGGQDHFYLEGQIAAALPQDDGGMLVLSSTQHPSEVQHLVAHALAKSAHEVTVQCRRMGGGFGGKESQPALFACVAAVFAARTGRAVKLRLDRDDDMLITGKRHDFISRWEVGFDGTGKILAFDVMLASRCGHSADLSGPVNDRAVCHVDNAYFIEHIRIESHRCRTHTVSNTAFRGFGGPQGMMVIEAAIDDIARYLGVDPADVRRRNFYGIGDRHITPYRMEVEDNVLDLMEGRLRASSSYPQRREAIARFNAQSPVIRRGIALTPVKFGISFNAQMFNQAGALVHVYNDGSVLLNHGGTEMGQGLHTKVMQVVADALGVPLASVRISATDTAKVPNTSATAASSGSDLNGKAAEAAALTIRSRLLAFASERYKVAESSIRIANGNVDLGDGRTLSFAQLARAAYVARLSLSSTGFYRTPKSHWDPATLTGRPFFYFAYGMAVAEVAIDTLTGESRVLRIDVLHDVGRSLNPAIDIGQIEGGLMQGIGWVTSEELWWNQSGELKTHAPSTYKIPTARDWPVDARIALLEDVPNREDTIHRSKAVGEPPFMLAIAVFHALRDAVASCGAGGAVPLDAPATPEAILRAVAAVRSASPRAATANAATA
ncbi:MAG: xanthine dehydrogenase molybdopterin binding subunit [Betaproteobacteria bacterium]